MQDENIIGILPPPSVPSEIPPPNGWGDVERCINTVLPADYKRFIGQYGSGRIDGFLWMFNPFSDNKNINLIDQLAVRVGGLKYLSEKFPTRYPYPLFPEPAGLFPFMGTDNGDTIYWVTDGDPNAWWVVVNDARSPMFEELRCGAVEFLYRLLTRKIVSKVLPSNFQTDPHNFKSVSEFSKLT